MTTRNANCGKINRMLGNRERNIRAAVAHHGRATASRGTKQAYRFTIVERFLSTQMEQAKN
jgi:hypothetical protein